MTNQGKHTPGKWTYDFDSQSHDFIILDEDKMKVGHAQYLNAARLFCESREMAEVLRAISADGGLAFVSAETREQARLILGAIEER